MLKADATAREHLEKGTRMSNSFQPQLNLVCQMNAQHPMQLSQAEPISLSFLRYLMVIKAGWVSSWSTKAAGMAFYFTWNEVQSSSPSSGLAWPLPRHHSPLFPGAQYNFATVDSFLSAPQKLKDFHVWAFAFAI